MITLIHGDHVEASREEFNQMKKRDGEIRQLDGRTLDASMLTQALESKSLFGGQSTVFIERLFGKLGRKQKLIESLASIIKNSQGDVVLWEDKELGNLVLKSLGKAQIKLFKLPSLIFSFLDNPSVALYEKLTENEAPELVHAMLTRRVRQLMQIRGGSAPTGMQSWQVAKLTRQANTFTMNELLSMYKKLLDMEYSIKSGSSPFSLKQLTEQFLIDL